jgi:hypothetical protein
MSKLDSLITVEYHKNRYTVAVIQHANNKIPILLDRNIYKIIKRLNKKWYINDKNHVYCLHTQKDENTAYPVYLHEVVVRFSPEINTNHINQKPIIHINNIHFDNRIENLQFDVPDKNYSKNTRKKSRIINLMQYGIDVNNLPTYMWYVKPDQSHGDRFTIEIPNGISWRTTASKKVSLRYKLEEAKKYLRIMKSERPDMFEEYSMNGDMSCTGLRLYREYNMMIGKAGFEIDKPIVDRTNQFLIKDISDLTNFEIYLLQIFDPKKGAVDVNDVLKDYENDMDNS